MSTALKPIRDCGPEFGRRVERRLRAEIRADERDATRDFSARMFEIGRDCDRFERAEAIQAECDRLHALSSPPIHRAPPRFGGLPGPGRAPASADRRRHRPGGAVGFDRYGP